MDQEQKTVSASATEATDQLAIESAQKQAQELFKEKYPEEKLAIIACTAASNQDGSFTAHVSIKAAQEDPNFDPASINPEDYQFMRKGRVREKLREIVRPTLEQHGFAYQKTKDRFLRKTPGQEQEVMIFCSTSSTFWIQSGIYLSPLKTFYKTFDLDPRSFAHFPVLSELFRDFAIFGHSFPGCPPYPDGLFESAAPTIIAALQEQVLPWIDRHNSLEALKDSLFNHCHNCLNHERILPILFLLDDREGLRRYLIWLKERMEIDGQPLKADFSAFYGVLSNKHPEFFMPTNEDKL